MGLVQLVRRARRSERNQPFLFHDERTEGDLHIVEIGAHQVEDIGHCLEAGVNFVVESIETLPDCAELLLR